MKKLLAGLFLGLLTTGALSQGTAFERAGHLHKGINLSMWYAQASDYSQSG